MRIQFVKNIQFTKLLKVEGRLREFNFRKLGGVNEGFFTVDVVDDRGNRILFRMQKTDDVETQLHEIIEEELRIANA